MFTSFLNLCRYVPGFSWLENQISSRALLRSFLTLCVFGFVPGAWVVGGPFALFYVVLKHKLIIQSVRSQSLSL